MENREIKFKIYLKKNGEIISVIFDYAQLFRCDAREIFLKKYSDWEIIGKGQYTGLKDKDCKEIYEGDIMETKPYGISEVKYELCGFTIDIPVADNTTGLRRGFLASAERYTIIGNLYENPELIKE